MFSHHSADQDEAHPGESLTITGVRIRKHAAPNAPDILKAFATITLNGVFVVHDLKIIQKPERLFVSMPACQNKSGRYRDIAHPIAKPFRDYLEQTVIDAYLRDVEDGDSDDGSGRSEGSGVSRDRLPEVAHSG